jgi:hypothetical protein
MRTRACRLASPLYRDITYRPLTIGITAVFKY